ncbi:Major Vault Protein [Manis pentadactyla]|nr:Major Vault Protein [Manis pentadactyla]
MLMILGGSPDCGSCLSSPRSGDLTSSNSGQPLQAQILSHPGPGETAGPKSLQWLQLNGEDFQSEKQKPFQTFSLMLPLGTVWIS